MFHKFQMGSIPMPPQFAGQENDLLSERLNFVPFLRVGMNFLSIIWSIFFSNLLQYWEPSSSKIERLIQYYEKYNIC